MPLTFKVICVSYMVLLMQLIECLVKGSHKEYAHWGVIMSTVPDAKSRDIEGSERTSQVKSSCLFPIGAHKVRMQRARLNTNFIMI